jgi:hypothetical protein
MTVRRVLLRVARRQHRRAALGQDGERVERRELPAARVAGRERVERDLAVVDAFDQRVPFGLELAAAQLPVLGVLEVQRAQPVQALAPG